MLEIVLVGLEFRLRRRYELIIRHVAVVEEYVVCPIVLGFLCAILRESDCPLYEMKVVRVDLRTDLVLEEALCGLARSLSTTLSATEHPRPLRRVDLPPREVHAPSPRIDPDDVGASERHAVDDLEVRLATKEDTFPFGGIEFFTRPIVVHRALRHGFVGTELRILGRGECSCLGQIGDCHVRLLLPGTISYSKVAIGLNYYISVYHEI